MQVPIYGIAGMLSDHKSRIEDLEKTTPLHDVALRASGNLALW